ncbi:glycosyltransferase [Jannaschia sp.]|nr:glycosyltransferase [Jannaschia sp.]
MRFENYPSTKVFHDASDISVLFFHDGTKTLPGLAESGLLQHCLCYFTFSWHVSDASVAFTVKKLNEVRAHVGEEAVRKHVRFLLNSAEEYDRAIQSIPVECCIQFSNSALLNETHYPHLGVEKTYDAVYNARANTFKRHELTASVESKIFVCYDWKHQDLDLEELDPKQIYRNLKGKEVARTVQQAQAGLMLSEVEGACYASLEYLLCGMPVVSTPSLGGRDAYYTEDNAIVCDPTPEAVAQAVDRIVTRRASGAFDPEEIRQGALVRMGAFRATLSEAMNRDLAALGQDPMPDDLLATKLRQTNKLWKFRNMRTQSLSDLAKPKT